jgi:hypothetical protein
MIVFADGKFEKVAFLQFTPIPHINTHDRHCGFPIKKKAQFMTALGIM